MLNNITDVLGVQVGHQTLLESATGCTVVLTTGGATAGIDIRGSAPGTRETDLLRPGNLVEKIHGVLVSGGSAFGLDAAAGVMQYLEEQGIGFSVGPVRVPIVPAAIIFDLGLVTDKIRPGPSDGYQACLNATSGFIEQGSVGAGTGATVGKVLGLSRSTKGGLGSSSIRVADTWTIGALAVVNALGTIVDPEGGKVLAGPRRTGGGFCSSMEILIRGDKQAGPEFSLNTTLVVVATDATLSREQATKLAQIAHDGLALSIRPCHTMGDGDVAFALATSQVQNTPNMNALCAATIQVVAQAVVQGILQATSLGGIPSTQELE